MSKLKNNFTEKQQLFIASYQGNATQACRDAGYKGTDKVLSVQGNHLLSNPNVCLAIQTRIDKAKKPLIATRQERQEFLTKVMLDTTQSMRDRLHALALLGKSEGDYIERLQLSGGLEIKQQVHLYLPDNGRSVKNGN